MKAPWFGGSFFVTKMAEELEINTNADIYVII